MSAEFTARTNSRRARLNLRPLNVLGGAAIVAFSFFGTLFVLDFMDSPDAVRVKNAKAIMLALDKFRSAHGGYPILPDGLTAQLRVPLANYLNDIPADPTGPQARYVSYNGKSYGLWIFQETSGPCLIEVGISGSKWWGLTQPCKL